MIIAAAIRLRGSIFTLPQPARHHDIMIDMVLKRDVTDTANAEHGFLDNTGHFHCRASAAKVAIAAGQIKKGLTIPLRLYTDDLW